MTPKEKTSPQIVLLLVWGVVLFFTVYGAAQIRDELGWRWLDGVAKVGETIGLSHVHTGIEAARGVVNADYLVLEDAVEDQPPVAAAEEPIGAQAHRSPSPKRRVLVVGASSIQFALGVELEHFLPRYEGVKAKRFGKLATGLSRPDFFDWPKKLEQLMKQFKPDLVIANFGGNCAQDIPVGGELVQYDDEEKWDPLYVDRAKALTKIAKKHGADFVFIGMPNMRDPKFAKKMERVNRLQRQAADESGAMFISVWEMTSTSDGKYKKSIEFEEERGLMRAIDGVHYRTLGARYIVEEMMQEVERHFLLSPAAPELARAEYHSFQANGSDRRIEYVAFVPKGASDQTRLPVLYVVPGAEGRWNEWPNYPHRSLQKLAERHRLVMVVLDVEQLTPRLFADEIAPDVEGHLPVSDRRGLVGPDLDAAHAALDQLEMAHTFKAADATVFRRSLAELVQWHAEQLAAPVTRR